jgi:hypothetical protein
LHSVYVKVLWCRDVSEQLDDQNTEGSKLTGGTFQLEAEQGLLEGWWFDPWQDIFKYFTILRHNDTLASQICSDERNICQQIHGLEYSKTL